ncbi:MAG: hypothetical protein ACFWT2_15500 [Thermoanaerobacterium thermosaccharolyticum]|jgi:hypothetical protein
MESTINKTNENINGISNLILNELNYYTKINKLKCKIKQKRN